MLLGYRLSTLLNDMEKRDLRKWKIMAAVVYAASVAFCAAVCARMSLGGVDEVQFLIEGSAEPDGYR